MRTIILFLSILLTACNGSSTTTGVDPSVQSQIDALNAKVKQLKLIGTPAVVPAAQTDVVRSMRMLGEPTLAPAASTVAGQFGPCGNMGVLIGFEDDFGRPANALNAVTQDFRQCTGYQYGSRITDGSVSIGERIFWDGPSCTGNLLEWEAGNTGFNTASLKNGVVFTNPFDGQTVLMVRAGQTPAPTLIQSVWVRENPTCQADVEMQSMYKVEPNDVSVSGVPTSGVGLYQLGSP